MSRMVWDLTRIEEGLYVVVETPLYFLRGECVFETFADAENLAKEGVRSVDYAWAGEDEWASFLVMFVVFVDFVDHVCGSFGEIMECDS